MSAPITTTNLDALRALIHTCLTPDLLSVDYRSQWQPDNPTAGLCSVASEAAWFVLGGSARGWSAYVCQDPDFGGTHWWLQHKSGLRFDPTEEQYTSQNRSPPYLRQHMGKPGGFMGIRRDVDNEWGFDRKPSRRAQILLDKMTARAQVQPSHPQW